MLKFSQGRGHFLNQSSIIAFPNVCIPSNKPFVMHVPRLLRTNTSFQSLPNFVFWCSLLLGSHCQRCESCRASTALRPGWCIRRFMPHRAEIFRWQHRGTSRDTRCFRESRASSGSLDEGLTPCWFFVFLWEALRNRCYGL